MLSEFGPKARIEMELVKSGVHRTEDTEGTEELLALTVGLVTLVQRLGNRHPGMPKTKKDLRVLRVLRARPLGALTDP